MITNLCKALPTNDLEANDKYETLIHWISNQANIHKLSYLLAHAEDGVIWGHFNQGKLVTSGEAFDKLPVLRPSTLQQCRIFGEMGEVFLWRTDNGWKSRLCQEINASSIDFIEEDQLLWGTKQIGVEKEGFTLVADGSQGLRHAVPLVAIPFSEKQNSLQRPIHLKVRHYINYDNEDGLAYIFLSRLVNLFIKDSRET